MYRDRDVITGKGCDHRDRDRDRDMIIDKECTGTGTRT